MKQKNKGIIMIDEEILEMAIEEALDYDNIYKRIECGCGDLDYDMVDISILAMNIVNSYQIFQRDYKINKIIDES